MRAILEIRGGPLAGRKVELAGPGSFSVGRSDEADWAIPEDRFLSNRHFDIRGEGGEWLLRDCDSANGTFLEGRRIIEARLSGDCLVAAGQTTFALRLDRDIASMLGRAQPLYAILDAARTPRILELLAGATERFESLYNGESAAHLAACAPYLVALPEKSRLLGRLAREGWGHNWGVFFSSRAPFEELRNHFRRYLIVRDEGGQEFYFRFYDPRVLRAFFAVASDGERAEFCGPVAAIWADRPVSLGGSER